MEKIKEFISKYKIVVLVLALVVISFIVYKVAFANEDIYENQINVTNTRVSIIDGDGDFDANDDAGNDSGPSNKIVRNFDQVTYNVQYDLAYKADSTLDEGQKTLDNTRKVIVDILVPNSMNMWVSESHFMNTLEPQFEITNAGTTYKYYSVEIQDASMAQSNNFSIVLSKINGKNGDVISPIIRVREATDSVNTKTITESTDVSSIDKINVDNVRISATEKYGIRLYQGVIKKGSESISSTLPVGMIVYLPNDAVKGIKGIQVPSNLSFNLNVQSSNSNSILLDESTIVDYPQGSEYVVSNLPISYGADKNGNAAIGNKSLNQNNNSTFEINFSNLNFDDNTQMVNISENESVYYLSSKVFTFKNPRQNNNKDDITYGITTTAAITNSISDYLDNYVAFVGDYTSEIKIFKSSSSSVGTDTSAEPDYDQDGLAVYNYGEEFFIHNIINYGLSKGDKLPNGYTSYVKVDNTAIKLLPIEGLSDQSKDYATIFSDGNSHSTSMKYGLGEWNSSYFKLKANRPSYCPSSLNNSSKEDLMNLYGGPCIEESDQVTWVDSINEAINANKGDKIIIARFDVLDEYNTGVQTKLGLRAIAVNNVSNVGNTFQIVSRGKTVFNNSDYYLSEIPNNSVSNHSQDMKYTKTQYNSNYEVTGGNVTTVNSNTASKNIGNTILISAFKSSINTINVRDAYNSPKNAIYSGMTDPVEFEINPVIYKSDSQASIKNATISVYLPETLEIYQKSGDKAYTESTSGNIVTIDGVNYKVYNYDYSTEDINFENESASGTIPNLYVHAYVALDIPKTDNGVGAQVLVRISGTLTKNSNDYNDVTSEGSRTKSVSLSLFNTQDINSIGSTDVTRMDKNGTYTYNMRSVNNTDSSADLSLIYILPYSGDSIGDGSNFSGSISASIKDTLPTGYKAYYTNDSAQTLLTKELNSSNVNWTEWTNSSTSKSGISAIKITSPSEIAKSKYFGNKSGITLSIKTKDNKTKDKYYNNFYMIHKNATVCKYEDWDDDCTTTEVKNVSYSSNISEVSIYNKSVSGYAFEDSNYNGLFDNSEPRLNNIPVTLFKLTATEFDANNPVAAISDSDKVIQEDTTDNNGSYSFEGLDSGNYYVKYTIDCDKYTATEKNKRDESMGDTSNIDSDAQMVSSDDSKTCYAVSNIQVVNNNSLEHSNINLGLRVRQNFDVNIKKYITNVVVNSNRGSQSYNYNKQTKVKVDVKNLKNTSFKVTYGIDIENSKYFPGTIGNIIETIPYGMTFNPNLPENSGWYESNGYLYYSNLNKTLIMPGESYHLTIVLDLVTNTGGNYVNFVAANNLQIKPVITDFLEVPDESTTIVDDSANQGEGE